MTATEAAAALALAQARHAQAAQDRPARTLGDALAQLPDQLPAQKLNPYGSHPQGTCRISADPRHGVCKPTGETHEVQNRYVADGSLFPTALGVNPGSPSSRSPPASPAT